MTTEEAARRVGVKPATLRRWASRGVIAEYEGDWTPARLGRGALWRGCASAGIHWPRSAAAALESGFPLAAQLQPSRVYGHAMAQVADAEVRLFHLYVHEPLLRSGAAGVEATGEMHALYREGDYYGRDVNIASRVAARSGGGEVLVTRPVVTEVGPRLEFERIAEVKLKGFSEATEIFIARALEDG
jgi:class 3 adenylate cyclase